MANAALTAGVTRPSTKLRLVSPLVYIMITQTIRIGTETRRIQPDMSMNAEMPKEFQEAVLMISLGEGESHGYELGEYLRRNGLPVDLATVYRKLQSMERRGLIASRWESSASGPARRIYSLTPDGFEKLWNDLEGLRDIQVRLGLMLDAAEESLAGRSRNRTSSRT
jgi:DNA-binding PadR family transcriptional regulator